MQTITFGNPAFSFRGCIPCFLFHQDVMTTKQTPSPTLPRRGSALMWRRRTVPWCIAAWQAEKNTRGKEGFHFWCGRVTPKLLRDQASFCPIWSGWIQPNSLTWIIHWGVFRSFSYPTMLVQLPVTHKMRSVCDLGVQFHSVYDSFSPPNTCTMHHDKLFGPYSTAKVQWPVRFACLHGYLPWEISKNRTLY